MGRLPGLGRGCRPVGGVGMQAALATVSELVRAGLGRLVCRLGWANGWSVAGGPAACHGAALPVGRQCRAGLALAASGRGCSGQAALVVAGRCELSETALVCKLCANTDANHLQRSRLAPALQREANSRDRSYSAALSFEMQPARLDDPPI